MADNDHNDQIAAANNGALAARGQLSTVNQAMITANPSAKNAQAEFRQSAGEPDDCGQPAVIDFSQEPLHKRVICAHGGSRYPWTSSYRGDPGMQRLNFMPDTPGQPPMADLSLQQAPTAKLALNNQPAPNLSLSAGPAAPTMGGMG